MVGIRIFYYLKRFRNLSWMKEIEVLLLNWYMELYECKVGMTGFCLKRVIVLGLR